MEKLRTLLATCFGKGQAIAIYGFKGIFSEVFYICGTHVTEGICNSPDCCIKYCDVLGKFGQEIDPLYF